MLQLLAQAATNYTYTTDSSTGKGSFAVLLIVYIALIAVTIVGMWKMFVKAGKPGWSSIIPIYNNVVMLEITGKPIWWIVLMFIPVVNLVVAILLFRQLARVFGKGAGFTLLMVFLPFIAFPILGFGDATYTAPQSDTPTDAGYPTPPTPPSDPAPTPSV